MQSDQNPPHQIIKQVDFERANSREQQNTQRNPTIDSESERKQCKRVKVIRKY